MKWKNGNFSIKNIIYTYVVRSIRIASLYFLNPKFQASAIFSGCTIRFVSETPKTGFSATRPSNDQVRFAKKNTKEKCIACEISVKRVVTINVIMYRN